MDSPQDKVLMVCISRLPPELKRRVWSFIKTERPATAAMLNGADPDCPFAQMMATFGECSIWLPVPDTGLTPAEVGSLSISMVSWRGGGITTPTPTHSMAADSCSDSAPKASSARMKR